MKYILCVTVLVVPHTVKTLSLLLSFITYMVLFQIIFVMEGTHLFPFSIIRITVTKKCFAMSMVSFKLSYRVRVKIHASTLTPRNARIAALLRASAMEQVNTCTACCVRYGFNSFKPCVLNYNFYKNNYIC